MLSSKQWMTWQRVRLGKIVDKIKDHAGDVAFYNPLISKLDHSFKKFPVIITVQYVLICLLFNEATKWKIDS